MESILNEGLATVNDIPQAISCLIMPGTGEQPWRASHYHAYIELLYVLKGSYELRVGSNAVRLPCHSLYVILPNQPHCTRRLEQEQTLLCIKLLPQILYSREPFAVQTEHLFSLILEQYSTRRLFDPKMLTDTPIPRLMEAIYMERLQAGFGYELALRAHLSELFLWLARYWHAQAGEPLLSIPGAGAARALSAAQSYIKEHFSCATLASTASACGLSYGYFSSLFSSHMKTSFSSYLRTVRVNASQPLLLSTNKSITEIALEVGFSSASHYIHAFHSQMGLSPGQFRRLFSSSDSDAGPYLN